MFLQEQIKVIIISETGKSRQAGRHRPADPSPKPRSLLGTWKGFRPLMSPASGNASLGMSLQNCKSVGRPTRADAKQQLNSTGGRLGWCNKNNQHNTLTRLPVVNGDECKSARLRIAEHGAPDFLASAHRSPHPLSLSPQIQAMSGFSQAPVEHLQAF